MLVLQRHEAEKEVTPPDTAHHYRQEMIIRVTDALNEAGPSDHKMLLHAASTLINLVRFDEDALEELLATIDPTDEDVEDQAMEHVLTLYGRY
jgi:hypothetical protein